MRAAVRGGGFARALRRPVAADAAALGELARRQYERRGEGLVLAAARTRHVAVGTDAVREALGRQQIGLLVVASDAANRRQELEAAVERLGRRSVVFGTRESLGRLFGRHAVGVLAILDARIADSLVHVAACVAALSEDA